MFTDETEQTTNVLIKKGKFSIGENENEKVFKAFIGRLTSVYRVANDYGYMYPFKFLSADQEQEYVIWLNGAQLMNFAQRFLTALDLRKANEIDFFKLIPYEMTTEKGHLNRGIQLFKVEKDDKLLELKNEKVEGCPEWVKITKGAHQGKFDKSDAEEFLYQALLEIYGETEV